MGVKVTGIGEVSDLIRQLETTTRRRAVKKLHEKGVEMRDLARKMAPIDDGNLEKAIKVRPETLGDRARDEMGRFVRTEIEVYVDVDMPVPDRPGKVVGDYAFEIHEHLTPAGPMQLGPRSEEKNQNNGGVEVGGGFLDRAAAEIEKGLEAAFNEILSGPL
ncbi:HK97 gp10 family phage protein [Herbaspirillum huttiense]|uniref:HK97 gp10 family phage protein n=1 Tax=Herbaspirillum huttiense subsp. lycopersici TaxID=3074428 RepID=A0ABU2EFV5_9BURK|nr:HK97 gp10 family phage protein [Herbaspirillum huttiense]MDR9847019.1 hypothetical protein [Herbaspirillum huttiense SE1]